MSLDDVVICDAEPLSRPVHVQGQAPGWTAVGGTDMPMLLERLKGREVPHHDGRRFLLRTGRDGRGEAVIECAEAQRGACHGAAIFDERILDACIADLIGDSGPHTDEEIGYALAFFYDRANDEGEGMRVENAGAGLSYEAGDRRRSG